MTLEKKRASLSDGEIAYVDEGGGPPVLLLHGFPTSSHLWRDLVPMLAPRFRAIAPDLLGYGDSEKPPRADLGHVAHTRRTAELLDRVGIEEFAVVAHDIGGGVAQRLALERACRAMVLIDSIPIDEEPIEAARMIQESDPERADEAFVSNLVEVALQLGMARPERLAAPDLEGYVRPWRADPPALVRAARGIQRAPGSLDDLGALDIPAFLLWGEEDPYLPPEVGERIAEALPRASFGVLPGCAHFLIEDAPETVLPLVAEWLRSQYLGEGHAHESEPQLLQLGVSFERPDRPDTPEGLEDAEELEGR